jgi:hypothetical protein
MKPLLALIAVGTVLGSAGAGVLVGHAAQARATLTRATQAQPASAAPASETVMVEQRIASIGQQIEDAHRLKALDFSQAHAIDRELFEVRGREHRLKTHDHGALARQDADALQSQLDQLADELHDSASPDTGRNSALAQAWDPSRA